MKSRISFIISFVLVLSALTSSAVLFVWQQKAAISDIESQVLKNATSNITQLENMLDTLLANNDVEDARLSLSVSALQPGVNTLVLVDEQDMVYLANRYVWEGSSVSVIPGFDRAIAWSTKKNMLNHLAFNEQHTILYGYFPVTLQLTTGIENRVGVLFVEYDLSTSIAEARHQALLQALYVGGFIGIVSALVAILLHLLVTRKVLDLAKASRQFAVGDLDARVEVNGNDELAILGDVFNQMAKMRKQAYEDLSAERERFQTMLETSPVAVGIARKGGRELAFANKSYMDVTQIDPSLVGEVNPKEFYAHKEDYAYIIQRVKAGEDVHNKLIELNIKGTHKWVMANYMCIEWGGEPAVLAWLFDITERIKLEDQMELAATVFDNSQEGIMVTDAGNRIVSVNKAFTKVTGYKIEEVYGHNPSMLSSGHHDDRFYQRLYQELYNKGYWQGEIWDRRANGEVYPKWASISVIRDDQGNIKNHVAIFSDNTERKEAQEKIEYLAQHDPLTGLPNRLLLRDRFDHAIAAVERNNCQMAMLFLDLDNFKEVNDNLGHEAGDQLLTQIAKRLKSCVRDTDTVCRQGGDEFIVLIEGIGDTGFLGRLAQEILDTVAEPYELQGVSVLTTFSIGISIFPDDGKDFIEIQKNADTAMYHAKESGRNGFRFFTEKMNLDSRERFEMVAQLRNAVSQQHFFLEYQPQVDMRNGRVVGTEALIRWEHPQYGTVSPAKFIPVAEESGLIVSIGEWVLFEACKQMQEWHDKGLPKISVAVNLSSLQFKRSDLYDTVCRALAASGLAAEYLELELTESILLHDTVETMDTVKRLKELGVKLSIDDFGTGYSSMSYLKQLSVDKLKIDQSFVRDLFVDAEDEAISKAIIQLGESMNLTIIAEGVETKAQLEFLRDNGCHEAQGFYFSRPVSPEGLEEYLVKNNEQTSNSVVFYKK